MHAETYPPAFIPRIRRFQDWLAAERGLHFADYAGLWRWSTTELGAFWGSLWDFEQMHSPTPCQAVLAERRMPGAVWFPGAQVNYTQRVWRHVDAAAAAGLPAIVAEDELGQVREISWPELQRQVATLALALQRLGLRRGDRVAAYLPNGPHAAVCFLACASLGAIWSLCAPDMGTRAVVDRFRQIEPRLLIAADGVHYGGKPQDRSGVLQELRAALPSVERLVLLRTPWAAAALDADLDLDTALAAADPGAADFESAWLPFDHPLWIVYSSGTTGLPKALVHSHGGVLMMSAANNLHNDIGASYEPNSFGERFHWYSSTGWVMWNLQVGGLTLGSTICLFDGSPSGPKEQPDWLRLWRFAARHRVSVFGAGAAFFANGMKAGITLGDAGDLSSIRTLGSTGSPLPEEVQRWGSAQLAAAGRPDVWWNNISGGTDFCGAFLAGHRELPPTPGRLQCRALGCAVQAWDEEGHEVIDQVGELVCTEPLPSMPLGFWNDPGNARYLSSYFDVYPGVWRHGDWLRVLPDGSCVIYGRSDATINRHGLRLGTSEIYAAVEALPEVLDSMAIDLEVLGRPSWLGLFVVLRPGLVLDDALRARIHDAIRAAVSPRFLPDEVLQAPEIPRTLSGKKQEVPVKKLLLGQPPEKVLNREAMANPDCLGWYLALAAQRAPAEPAR